MKAKPLIDSLLYAIQALLFVLFVGTQNLFLESAQKNQQLPAALEPQLLRLMALGEPALLARALAFWLQSYDSQSGTVVSYRLWNYDHLIDWFRVMMELDPQTEEPLLAASRIFIEVKDEMRLRKMVDFIREQYRISPDRRWRWMVDATLIVKHRLKDQALALEMARELRLMSRAETVPYWVRDIEHLILAEIGEWESASLIISSMLEAGVITDAHELQFLTRQLRELKQNINKSR